MILTIIQAENKHFQMLSGVNVKVRNLKKILGLYDLGPLPDFCVDEHLIFLRIRPFGSGTRSVSMLGSCIAVNAQ